MEQNERQVYLIKRLLDEQPQYKNMQIPSDQNEQRSMLRSLMNVRMPKSIDREFLEVQDDYLKEELAAKTITDLADLVPVSDGIYVWQGDITTLRCDAIVNAANSGLTGCYVPCHRCIDNCIHTYAGMQLRLACAEIIKKQGHEEKTGTAKLTPAYNLPCRYVIHTVGPIVSGPLTETHRHQLASCYRSCLELAEKNGIKSIAFCCISTGEFHFPNETAAAIAVETVKSYKRECNSAIQVIFNVFKDADWRIYQRLLKDTSQRISFEQFLSGRPADDYIFQDAPYEDQIKQAASMIQDAEYVLLGAGAGMSAAAGAQYGGQFFRKHFGEFIRKYGSSYMKDMYSAGFYPFPDEESKWGYWSKQALLAGIDLDVTPLHRRLLGMLQGKKIFLLTTNVDGQFARAGLPEEQIFATQGSYGYIQCKKGCHPKIYPASEMFRRMDQARNDCRIPSALVPKCPVCGGPMEMNLRSDSNFVQDENWEKAESRFSDFLLSCIHQNTVLLELGVGFNTPTIIRFPFEQMVREHKNIRLIRLNLTEAIVPQSFGGRAVGINADMAQSIADIAEALQM